MGEAWAGSRGQGRNWKPPGWAKTRLRIMRRAHGQCEHVDQDRRCNQVGAECDHIIPVAEGGTHDDTNLQWLCSDHHNTKSQAEAQRGQQRRRSLARRPTEPHPGLTNT